MYPFVISVDHWTPLLLIKSLLLDFCLLLGYIRKVRSLFYTILRCNLSHWKNTEYFLQLKFSLKKSLKENTKKSVHTKKCFFASKLNTLGKILTPLKLYRIYFFRTTPWSGVKKAPHFNRIGVWPLLLFQGTDLKYFDILPVRRRHLQERVWGCRRISRTRGWSTSGSVGSTRSRNRRCPPNQQLKN